MPNWIDKILDHLLGPEAIVADPGFDPTQEPLKIKTQRKNWIVVGGLIGVPLVLCGIVFGVSRALATPTATPCKEPALCPGTLTATATLPAPGMTVEGDTPIFDNVVFETATPLPNLLTAMAALPSSSPTRTQITVDGILTSIVTTPCAAENFLTQQVCDDADMTATFDAVGIGTPINVSGVDPKVTIVYLYPTYTWTPHIITATPSPTPMVVTATLGATQTPIYVIVTATPGPTQTPWFFITQPPVVTVIWTQLVTVVVTATPSETISPSETPTPTETQTPTETPTP